MAKCTTCPHWRTCRDECYGDNPCDFAVAFDRLSRKTNMYKDIVGRQKTELEVARRNATAPDVREFGDYILTPVMNPSNGKVDWWISKKGFTTARYCFTAPDEKEVEYQIKNGLSGYIRLLNDTLDGADAPDRIDRFLKDLLWALPKAPSSDLIDDDTGFWTDGSEILCPSEEGAEALAEFLTDVLRGNSSITVATGWYDPFDTGEDAGPDDHAGFNYVRFE